MGFTSNMAGILKRRHGYKKRKSTEDNACEARGRNWSDVSISQGILRISSNQQKLEEARKSFSLEILEEAWPC